MKMLTTVVGKINGADFRAKGDTECPEPGQSRGELHFDEKIPNFTPMLCRTWHCKHHPSAARMALSEINPLSEFLNDGGRIMEYTEIEYPRRSDSILVTSICERPRLDVQVVYQTRLGNYTGPTDIVEQLPFNIGLTPVGPGAARGFSVREVVRTTGERISIRYHDQIFFSNNFELPFPMNVEISGEAHYNVDDLRFTLDTQMIARRTSVSSHAPA